ncbi:MAG: threonylcarbamoyl-AMP synthase [Parcubacteria group bacterium]|nr:threonylcarbamoyl-AMP synthase [Parcubacteria group bacterium]
MNIVKKVKISDVVSLLKKGGVVVCPTETAYGFSCDATNKKAIEKIYIIKGRPKKKAVLLICADLKMVKKHFEISEEELKLASKYWPGPLSLILKPKSKKLNYQKDFGVRIPAHNLCQKISKELDRPISTTSANITDKPTPYGVKYIERQFKNKKYQPDLIINEGKLKQVKPSTIIKVIKGKITVLRQGPIKL